MTLRNYGKEENELPTQIAVHEIRRMVKFFDFEIYPQLARLDKFSPINSHHINYKPKLKSIHRYITNNVINPRARQVVKANKTIIKQLENDLSHLFLNSNYLHITITRLTDIPRKQNSLALSTRY